MWKGASHHYNTPYLSLDTYIISLRKWAISQIAKPSNKWKKLEGIRCEKGKERGLGEQKAMQRYREVVCLLYTFLVSLSFNLSLRFF
jgi:hypothetical protein